MNTAASILTKCNRHVSISRCAVCLLLLCQSMTSAAQSHETTDSIRINPQFLKELDQTFSFSPIEADVKPQDDILTREQLHEWVGPVEGASAIQNDKPRSGKYDPTDPNRFDSTYFALKMYLVDFCHWQPIAKPDILIPGLDHLTDGLQHYGKHAHSLRSGGIGCALDVNALSKYVRPSEIRLRKSRALAESAKAKMDQAFPLEGEAPTDVPDTAYSDSVPLR